MCIVKRQVNTRPSRRGYRPCFAKFVTPTALATYGSLVSPTSLSLLSRSVHPFLLPRFTAPGCL